MIELRIRFWTDEIAKQPGHVVPKHAWDNGIVVMDSNKDHGISPQNPKPFRSLMDLTSVIEKVLIEHGITLHPGARLAKYLEP